VWVECVEQIADAFPGCLDGSFFGLSQKGFELGEDLLDRVEVGRVGRQEEELGAGGADGSTNGFAFVATEIVHDDDVALLERGHEDLLDIGQEAPAVDRTVDDAGRVDPVRPQCRQEGQRPPFAERRLGEEPLTSRASSMPARHVGLGPGLVDEDQPRRIELGLMALPALTPPCDVGPVLLRGVQAFF
jgi:hypothetical protein